MKNRTRKHYSLISFCLAMMLLVGCAAGSAAAQGLMNADSGKIEGTATTEQVDRMVVALSTTTVNVSPFAPSTPSVVMKSELYATLMQRPYYGAPLEELVPMIAKSCTSEDGITYEIELFDNIVDSKGNPIKADDVIFSYENSISLAQFRNAASDMEPLQKVDDTHLIMKLTNTTPGVIENLLTNQQLYIVSKDWYENASDEEKNSNPATTAGYYVKSFSPGSGAVLAAVEDYWQKDEQYLPNTVTRNVKEIEFRAMTEPSMRVVALENKEVDNAGINASDLGIFYDSEAAMPLPGWNVAIVDSYYTYSMYCNMDSGKSVLADNADLRKAVFYALDSEEIMLASGNTYSTAQALKGFGVNTYGGYLSKWDEEEYYEYNPDKAAEHLAAAGYKKGEVTLTILASSALYNDSTMAVIISELNEVGINVKPLSCDQALFSTYKDDSSQWDLMLDLKGCTTGHIASMWNLCFNPASYSNGSVCFTHDDELTNRLNNVLTVTDDASIDAFHQYLKDNAICMGLYTTKMIFVSQDGILEHAWYNGSQIVSGACIFSENYKSAENY